MIRLLHAEIAELCFLKCAVDAFRDLREKTTLTATSGKGLAELQHGKNFFIVA